MKNEFAITEKEKKNKKRGILFAFFFHAGLIIFGLIPFLTKDQPEPKYDNVIEIAFADFQSSSKKADDNAGAQKKAEAKKTTKKKVQKKVEPKKPEPKPQPRKPVLTEKSAEVPVKTSPEPAKKRPEPVEKVEEVSKETSEAATESTNTTSGNSTNNGNGTGQHGTKNDKGKQGEGMEGEDFTGTAIFNRKVIYRPDIKKIVKKQGRIAINLCINREGRVILVKYDKENSTIRDTDNIRKTLEATKKYKFERDYTVPKQQCGKLTFIIDKN